MDTVCRRITREQEGKGTMGCMVFLVLVAIATFIGFTAGPSYFAYKSLETDLKAEISRAGANFHDDDTILRNVMALAKRNEIRLKRENVKLERFAGQVHVTLQWQVPVDFAVYSTILDYKIKASSYIGRL